MELYLEQNLVVRMSLEKGDCIEVLQYHGGKSHWGVYTGKDTDTVIHLVRKSIAPKISDIKEDSFWDAVGKGQFKIRKNNEFDLQMKPFGKDDIVRRAKVSVKEHHYYSRFLKCSEQFVKLVRYGVDKKSKFNRYSIQNLDEARSLEKGDRIEIFQYNGAISHWGVYTGQDTDTVIHVIRNASILRMSSSSSLSESIITADDEIREDSFWDAVGNGQFEIRKNNEFDREIQPFEKDEIVLRAKRLVGGHHYSLFSNNCEHFVNLVRYGVCKSSQINKIFENLQLLILSLYCLRALRFCDNYLPSISILGFIRTIVVICKSIYIPLHEKANPKFLLSWIVFLMIHIFNLFSLWLHPECFKYNYFFILVSGGRRMDKPSFNKWFILFPTIIIGLTLCSKHWSYSNTLCGFCGVLLFLYSYEITHINYKLAINITFSVLESLMACSANRDLKISHEDNGPTFLLACCAVFASKYMSMWAEKRMLIYNILVRLNTTFLYLLLLCRIFLFIYRKH